MLIFRGDFFMVCEKTLNKRRLFVIVNNILYICDAIIK